MISVTQFDKSYTPPSNLLNGRTILITGAGDGIGRELALTAAHFGAEVILLGRTQAKLEAVYDQIESETQSKAIVCPVDLEKMDEDQAKEIAQLIQTECGKLDGLVHNAGILGQRTPHTKLFSSGVAVSDAS